MEIAHQFQDTGEDSKELDESNDDYEKEATQMAHLSRSDNKRTTEFGSVILTRNDNDSNESIKFITKLSEFLLRFVVHEDIRLVGWFVGFNGISTFVRYLMPNLFYTDNFISNNFSLAWVHSLIIKKTFLFQAIQFI